MRALRSGRVFVGVLAVAGVLAPVAHARRPPGLAWRHCGRAADTQCASARVPPDYDAPRGKQISLFVARLPATDHAHRLGALFVNFGGPGDPAADVIESSPPPRCRRSTTATTSSRWTRAA